MNNVFASLTVTALIPCLTQIPAQSQVAKWYTLGAGTTIPAMLDKWVDARKSKVGDEVVAQTTEPVREHGQVIIPKGSKIFGRVTEAKSRTTEDPNSVLGITFDHAVLKKGGELRLRVMIEA
jgi:type IV secretory pathway VirB10-like protein